MNVVLRKPTMSLDEFLAWDERQEGRWEFDGRGPVGMVGGTIRHHVIVGNLNAALRQRLRPPCRSIRETFRFRTSLGTIRYPDVMIVCSRLQPEATEATDPVVVFEVLSGSTSGTDRVAKVREYQATPSVRCYVILEQDEIAATVLRRVGEVWDARVLVGDAVLDLPEVGVALSLLELYAETEVEGDPAAIRSG
jgi:Uma2 family endonuclease